MVIVHEIIGVRFAIAVIEGPVRQGREISADRFRARRIRVGAVGVGAVRIARLRVPVIRPRPRVRIFDLAGWRVRQNTVSPVGDRMAGRERLKIRAGAAHYRLMMIVAERIIFGELAEIRRVAGGHVVEAHRDGALVRAGVRIRAVLRAFARGLVHPDEEITSAAVDLLPHLEETVHRVANRCGVIDVSRDLEGPVRQQCRKPRVRRKARQPWCIGRAGPRQLAIGPDNLRRYLVGVAHLGATLSRVGEFRSWVAVAVDNAL